MFSFRHLFASALFGVVLTTGVFATSPVVHAATIADQYTEIRSEGLIFANICNPPFEESTHASPCACKDYGKCTLPQVVQMFVNVSYLILALSGSAALIAFVYGGFEWVLSAGYAERVDRGKKAIVGAAVGLGIVFGAYVFINLVISILVSGAPAVDTIENTIGGDAKDIIKSE